MIHKVKIALSALLLAGVLSAEEKATEAKPPFWAEDGVFVYRVFTPDRAETLTYAEEGIHIVSNLLDGTVPQVPVLNGIIGHDHPGKWNWDGLWPYWNRVTFRAGNSWEQLSKFMSDIKDESNALASFHVNLTDVNTGLRDYPKSREFFDRLVETESIYRRDWDKETNKRAGTPYVPEEIMVVERNEEGEPDPVPIFALVNYQNFWESGLAKEMIDEFYANLPYAPPVLYLDVLNLSGGNFSTGYPDGPLGGSRETQLEGMIEIVDYLREKGTDLGTEGNRKYLGQNEQGAARAGYVWYHGSGYSNDDYSVISGGYKLSPAVHHVFGNPGAFAVSPIGSTAEGIETVEAHYEALLAGKAGLKEVAPLEDWHITNRPNETLFDEFDVPGANGDRFRGDWADLVNYFYMAVIQENYHIGNRAVRVERAMDSGRTHLGTYTLTQSGTGDTITRSVPEALPEGWRRRQAMKFGFIMLESPIETEVTVPQAGTYGMSLTYRVPGRGDGGQLNIYVNGQLHEFLSSVPRDGNGEQTLELSAVELQEGVNTIAFDHGPIRAEWSDGTIAEWTTPYLRTGFKAWNGEVVFAEDYDRMWPDTWSGAQKIYFFSWDGTHRSWLLPESWRNLDEVTLVALTPNGRGENQTLKVVHGKVAPELLPQIPYVMIPGDRG